MHPILGRFKLSLTQLGWAQRSLLKIGFLSKFLIRKKQGRINQLALQLQFFLSSIDAILEVSHCQSEGISWTYTSNTSQDVQGLTTLGSSACNFQRLPCLILLLGSLPFAYQLLLLCTWCSWTHLSHMSKRSDI